MFKVCVSAIHFLGFPFTVCQNKQLAVLSLQQHPDRHTHTQMNFLKMLSLVICLASSTSPAENEHEQPQQPMVTYKPTVGSWWVLKSFTTTFVILIFLVFYPSLHAIIICACACVSICVRTLRVMRGDACVMTSTTVITVDWLSLPHHSLVLQVILVLITQSFPFLCDEHLIFVFYWSPVTVITNTSSKYLVFFHCKNEAA